ncbi:hypothetical protein [Maribellus mangrovi]|uniref:hypothetical protein n=1 Tax=Maribellus mangrovi TaxID=3133146 RepID=UPI0030EF118B
MKWTLKIAVIASLVLVFQSCSNLHLRYKKTDDLANEATGLSWKLNKALYKARITFFNKEYSGLMFFKEYPETKDVRMIFMSEFGLKFFDLKLDKNGTVTTEYIIDELNRKSIINTLSTDFRLLFLHFKETDCKKYFSGKNKTYMQKCKKGKFRYSYFFNNNNKIETIKYASFFRKKVTIELKEYENNIPGNVTIKHFGIPLKLNLNYIK